MGIYMPYTYLIGWSELDKWYYGVEYATKTKTAHPDNLWKSYFTSSERVERFRAENGEPNIIEIRKTFTNGSDDEKMLAAVNYEEKVLRRMKVIYQEKWLNLGNGRAIVLDDAAKKKIGTGNSKKKRSEEQKQKQSERMKLNNPFRGKKHTIENRKLMSERMKGENHPNWGKPRSEETRKRMSIAATGKKLSDEHRKSISQSHNKVYICPHCNKSGGRLLLRWHFDHCKFKASICNL